MDIQIEKQGGITIGKNWKMEADSLNIIVSQRKQRVSKSGEKYYDWETMGFFSRMDNALNFLVEQGIRDTLLKDVKTVVAKIAELEKLIQTIAKTSQRSIEDTLSKS